MSEPANHPSAGAGQPRHSGTVALAGVDIGPLFSALQEEAVIIDLKQSRVAWCSPAFSNRFPAVQSGTPLDSLLQLLDGLAACFSDMREETKRAMASSADNQRFAVTRVILDGGRAVLRLENLDEYERMMQRHLEDREKLLFTSRAISVSEMATTLAHELNQPIGTISNLLRGISLRMRRGEYETAEILEALDCAIDQVLFAAKIITRVREYTQSFQPRRTEIDLAALVEASTALLDWEMQREGVTVTHTGSGASPFLVTGDEVMLQQVFVNLLRNAVDAMRGVSRGLKHIRVTVQRSDGQIEVSISDSGCGLSPEEEKNLFVPFVSTKPTGMGVGLNICRSFVELHQGRLWMSSNPGAGCTFHIALPEAGGSADRHGE